MRPILGRMAWTQSQLDALKSAYAEGALTISENGRTVTFGSAADLLARIRTIEAEINSTSTSRYKPRFLRATFDDA